MVFLKQLSIGLVTWLTLSGCANGPLGDSLQRSLEADSQLEENPPFDQSASTPTETESSAAALTADTVQDDLARPEAQVEDHSTPNSADSNSGLTFTDIDQAPEELQRYITDLAQLGLIKPQPSSENSNVQNSQAFRPNQAISRREFARWLVNTNNQFYQDNPAQKIRLGVSSNTPAFQDIPTTDPDFSQIQGLAEAGIIPSTLAGNATAVNFRPDAQLTREDLLLWKVPLDVRQTLPSATIQAIEEAWGFQDAAKIDPLALPAVLADHTNGDFANIRRVFGFTTLLQPQKAVTRAEAAATIWRFGNAAEGITAEEIRQSDSPS